MPLKSLHARHVRRAARAALGEETAFEPPALGLVMSLPGKFLEHAEVHGNVYGTSFAALDVVKNQGKICILDIDVQARSARRQPPPLPTAAVRPKARQNRTARAHPRPTALPAGRGELQAREARRRVSLHLAAVARRAREEAQRTRDRDGGEGSPPAKPAYPALPQDPRSPPGALRRARRCGGAHAPADRSAACRCAG